MNQKRTKLSDILGVLEGETGDVFVSTHVIFSVFGYDLFEKKKKTEWISKQREREREEIKESDIISAIVKSLSVSVESSESMSWEETIFYKLQSGFTF